jgi:poly-gamma-glutamate capsule biosynthesis protein CapA/YwtB (metallophosphatase superfamily)
MGKNKLYAVLVGLLFVCQVVGAQDEATSMSLLFGGDIMCHDTQLAAAYNATTHSYDFSASFSMVSELVASADLAFANLETVLGSAPYRGYPDFSSPEALAVAIKECGFDVLVTANNHSADRGKRGIVRTNRTLDSLGIMRTGTFADTADYRQNHPLLIERNGISMAVLNYTYGINSPRYPKSTVVNVIDTTLIKMDLLHAKRFNPDFVVVFLHWGEEYLTTPTTSQQKLTKWLADNGVQLIVGSHPHVLQRMEWHVSDSKNYAVAYSLGNFLSGQRTAPRDGGALLKVEVTKKNGVTQLTNVQYALTYVHYPKIDGVRRFMVVPVTNAENGTECPGGMGWGRLSTFAEQSRLLMRKNVNVSEMVLQKSPE